MKLQPNLYLNGSGKYALIDLDSLEESERETIHDSLIPYVLLHKRNIELGVVGDPDEFIVIKLRDPYAYRALLAYANEVQCQDPDFANNIRKLALRAKDKLVNGSEI